MSDFSIITEHPDTLVSQEQLSRAYCRYKFAQKYCENKNVLELASGGGQGIQLLAQSAKQVIASDVNEKNLSIIKNNVEGKIKNVGVKKINAESIDLPDSSIDTIIFYEAIYYLENIDTFLLECKRILRHNGTLIICSANKEWNDFNPSAFSKQYLSASELYSVLKMNGFSTQMYYSDKVEQSGFRMQLISLCKRIAIRLHLIPKSMRFKKYFKRLFMGKLVLMPTLLDDGIVEYSPPLALNPESYDTQFKVIYAVASYQK